MLHSKTVSPEFGVGDANANCPPPLDFVIQVQNERSVVFKNKSKSVSGPGSAPDPTRRAHVAPPEPLVG